MPKDFFISAGIMLAGRTAFAAAVGGSVRQIDSLGKEVEQLNARAKRIRAVQALTSEVSRTEVAAREARTRAEHLGRAFATTARPTRTLRQHLESARREADRLSDSLDEQRRRLGEQQTAMRQAGDSVADFARVQKRLSDARAERGHLTGLVGQREKARTARVQRRSRPGAVRRPGTGRRVQVSGGRRRVDEGALACLATEGSKGPQGVKPSANPEQESHEADDAPREAATAEAVVGEPFQRRPPQALAAPPRRPPTATIANEGLPGRRRHRSGRIDRLQGPSEEVYAHRSPG